jgi:nitrate reductase gamma subunit
MSADADPDASTANADEFEFKPHHVAIALGLGLAVFTAISGIVPLITDWHNDNDIHREVFGNVPGPLKLAFYTLLPLVLAWGSFKFADRMKNWERGRPAKRRTTTKNVQRRAEEYRGGVYMQTLLRDRGAGLMHSMIYFGFLVLLGVTTVLEVDHQLPEDLKFLHGRTYQAYAFVGDAAGVVFLGGVTWAIIRRYVQRPYRIRIKSKVDHVLALGSLFLIGVTGFTSEMLRIALNRVEGVDMGWEKYSFVGYPLAELVDGWSVDTLQDLHQLSWIGHVVAFIVFLAILPGTMLRHMFTSPLNMYLAPKDRPKGAMKPMPNLMETELESFGA